MEVLEKLEIKPIRESLFVRAFTHTSYANEHKTESYEMLR